ncbi:MAG: hypothetical protein U0793_08660 [Gemmataceae bacterium]
MGILNAHEVEVLLPVGTFFIERRGRPLSTNWRPLTEVSAARVVAAALASGGLISILRSNLGGGRNPPRAWLCLDQLGNVTHTFIPERGTESVGLSRRKAERVLSESRHSAMTERADTQSEQLP